MLPSLFVLHAFLTLSFTLVTSHHESGEWSCQSSDSGTRLTVEFKPGIVTLDGLPDDWKDIDGFDFSLLPALDPHEDDTYKGGKMNVKAVHDGKDVFILLQVDGEYAYSKGKFTGDSYFPLCLLTQRDIDWIGENATYHNMGGCKESPGFCTNKTCRGYEVDIMHFSIGTAIPGRLYGGNLVDVENGSDRFGHLVDVYSWNPHCQYLDGLGPSGSITTAQNDWKGAWWHSSFSVHPGFVDEDSPYASNGKKGTYYFEFSRPLRTMDRFQQDAQFKIGDTSKFSVAFWYPVDGNPWHGSGHYTVSCDWLPLDFICGGSTLTGSSTGTESSWDAAVAFSLLFSVVAICISIFVVCRISMRRDAPYTEMSRL